MASLNQYKHHLLVLFALLLARFVIVPLSDSQVENSDKLKLLEQRYIKMQSLIANQGEIENMNATLTRVEKRLRKFVYQNMSEADFKLNVQKQIESSLGEFCTIERIGFKGNAELNESLTKWRIEMKIVGDALCMLRTTRKLEGAEPMLFINSFTINHRALKRDLENNFNMTLEANAFLMRGQS